MIRALEILRIVIIAGMVFATSAVVWAQPRSIDLSFGMDPMVLDLAVPYGGSQTTPITITNSATQPERVIAMPADWQTSVRGDVELRGSDSTGAHSLTKYLRLSPSSLTLQPGESRQIALNVQLPQGDANSKALWGGFVVRAAPVDAPSNSMSAGATLFVYDAPSGGRRHLRMMNLSTSRASDGLRMDARLFNDGDLYARPTATVRVEQRGRKVREADVPMNVIFPGMRRDVSASIGDLPPGAYDVRFTVDYGTDTTLEGATHARIP